MYFHMVVIDFDNVKSTSVSGVDGNVGGGDT
jgi:hypothetical protein